MLTQSPAEIIKRIRKLEILTKIIVSEQLSGNYHSSFRGQGLEFAEVREYQAGDSFRSIDWNVSARYGAPYIKKFRETRELNVFLIVDVSASMDFATLNAYKRERMAEIAAVLSFSAPSNHDKVGMLMYSSALEKYLPPRQGKKSALQILREILYYEPKARGSSLAGALESTLRLLKKRSVVFILSDFLDKGFSRPLEILARKHDVIALQILDDAELVLPKAGLVRLHDPETGLRTVIDSSHPELRKVFEKAVNKEQAALEAGLKRMQVEHVLIKNSDSYGNALRLFFERRAQRLRRRRR